MLANIINAVHNIMNQNTALIVTTVIIAILVAFGAWWIWGQGQNTNQQTDTNNQTDNQNGIDVDVDVQIPKTHEIVYTDSGYAPSNLTIKVGDTVSFKNNSSKGMWPASAMHPTHMVYGGTSLEAHCPDAQNDDFDACQSISSGQSWSFTFTKSGAWGFHDHLIATRFGKITVEE